MNYGDWIVSIVRSCKVHSDNSEIWNWIVHWPKVWKQASCTRYAREIHVLWTLTGTSHLSSAHCVQTRCVTVNAVSVTKLFQFRHGFHFLNDEYINSDIVYAYNLLTSRKLNSTKMQSCFTLLWFLRDLLISRKSRVFPITNSHVHIALLALDRVVYVHSGPIFLHKWQRSRRKYLTDGMVIVSGD